MWQLITRAGFLPAGPKHKMFEDDEQAPEAAGWISKSAMATASIEHSLFQRKEAEEGSPPQARIEDR